MVGLDAGVTKLATLSDGTVYQPVNSFKASQRKLAMLQRQLSRKVKFSASWQKQKKKSSVCTHTLPISGATTFTKSPVKSAKTTR